MVLVAPSILSADFSCLGKEIKALTTAGADLIHIDVMDGVFVPNLTFGAPVIKSIRKDSNLPFDVHLMVEKPSIFIPWYAKAGADIITFHVEINEDVTKNIELEIMPLPDVMIKLLADGGLVEHIKKHGDFKIV